MTARTSVTPIVRVSAAIVAQIQASAIELVVPGSRASSQIVRLTKARNAGSLITVPAIPWSKGLDALSARPPRATAGGSRRLATENSNARPMTDKTMFIATNASTDSPATTDTPARRAGNTGGYFV